MYQSIISYVSFVYDIDMLVFQNEKTIILRHKQPLKKNRTDRAFYFAENYLKTKMPDFQINIQAS